MSAILGDADQEKLDLPRMTNFEKATLIKKRVKQLNNGYKSTMEDIVKENKLTRAFDIAMLEFELGKLPYYEIKRERGDGSYELWRHDDFKFFPDHKVFEYL